MLALYVEREKKWAPGQYAVQVFEKKGGSPDVTFEVVFFADIDPDGPMLSGGKSFTVQVDMTELKILKVLHYQ